ncbi:hypothetical protein SAMN05444266_109272 [Chitinophaga jiangningensis]|uniref:Uncharacterized protein n=1 Tax=Chitinophaga jiangningensis TaxID=1419482 RepID=A0A1M7KFB5_9BACT|nr:hypothetical protein SAMN05444266_109272 [Chitinophaga jiangningensis]
MLNSSNDRDVENFGEENLSGLLAGLAQFK